jgi:hypothetical protein
MRKCKVALLVVAAVIVAGVLAVFWPQSEAAAQRMAPAPQDFSQVQIVTYQSGLTGFFDAKTGRLYLYESGLDQPSTVRQISRLGAPVKKIRK